MGQDSKTSITLSSNSLHNQHQSLGEIPEAVLRTRISIIINSNPRHNFKTIVQLFEPDLLARYKALAPRKTLCIWIPS
jgi:hypothetical protein